jgi:hypothetical protein
MNPQPVLGARPAAIGRTANAPPSPCLGSSSVAALLRARVHAKATLRANAGEVFAVRECAAVRPWVPLWLHNAFTTKWLCVQAYARASPAGEPPFRW